MTATHDDIHVTVTHNGDSWIDVVGPTIVDIEGDLWEHFQPVGITVPVLRS
jgi:hypothetical protein